MSFPNPLEGHVDAPLTNFAVAYRNPAFIADEVMRRVAVGRQSDLYYKWGKENLDDTLDDIRAAGAAAQRIARTLSTVPYFTPDHSFASAITKEEEAEAGAASRDVRREKTQLVMDRILLRKEKLFADLVTDTAKITQNTTLAGVNQWSDGANSKPITNVQTGHETIAQNSGIKANTLVLGFPVFSKLRTHPSLVDRVSNVKIGAVSIEDLAAVFDVAQVLVSQAINKAGAFVFGKHALLCYVSPSASLEDIAFGKTFAWAGAPASSGGIVIEEGPDPPPSRRSTELAGHFYYDQIITALEAAYLIKNAVA